nr:uncharacterized protein LOC128671732 [Plodia interpunctella]
MEAEETASHLLLECRGVASTRQEFLGNPGTMSEACRSPSAVLRFLKELGWLEWSAAQTPHAERAQSRGLTAENSPRGKNYELLSHQSHIARCPPHSATRTKPITVMKFSLRKI